MRTSHTLYLLCLKLVGHFGSLRMILCNPENCWRMIRTIVWTRSKQGCDHSTRRLGPTVDTLIITHNPYAHTSLFFLLYHVLLLWCTTCSAVVTCYAPEHVQFQIIQLGYLLRRLFSVQYILKEFFVCLLASKEFFQLLWRPGCDALRKVFDTWDNYTFWTLNKIWFSHV